ncbi:energy-coupling factor transporter transmembrane component T [Pseudoramibacter sp.]|uniref:energy-coupling factor transporter transmembrane component T n=1 Tax=Pseudoramibacter sp. TaxID=2034862 RepID=UPI0026003C4E|nr:energy-coupling factor transporter transmembrane component T [Pseudoramibacter sp.]MCH4071549.1 energy-coupling factor transporter transmembrane protein EcfT [Pseudoramibacter sp.]MCH4105317.1 energy-coupling factor transporter transmembrane protein EcfT [Pseudoramibacter sp.]
MKLNLKILKLTGRLLNRDMERKPDTRSRVLPVLRVGAAVLCILLCALSRNAVFVITIITVELFRTAMLPPDEIAHILKALILPAIFTLLIMLPAVFFGHPKTMFTVTLKVLESVMVIAVLNSVADWQDLTQAFSLTEGTSMLVMILDMTMRFLMILGDYSNQLLEAVTLRSVGRDSWKHAKVDGILGTTFLKSRKMAEETSEAMACRCFDGRYRCYESHRFSGYDLLYLGVAAIMVLFFVKTQKGV